MKTTKRFAIAALALTLPFISMACMSSKRPSTPAIRAESRERMVAYTATISLETDKPDKTRQTCLEACKELGGFVTRESHDSLLLRIPAPEYRRFLDMIGKTGKIAKDELEGEDITDSYQDLSLQLESKRAVRAKYSALLEKAVNVQETLAVEKELERINLEIERLEGKLAQAEKRVAFVTVNVSIQKKVMPGPLGWIFYIAFKAIAWLFVWN